jgi:geranylgeranyl pyrophosphate synthase
MSESQRGRVQRLMEIEMPPDGLIQEVVADVAERGGLAYARERALGFARRAEAELEVLQESPARETLRASLTYVLDRRK